MKIKLEKDIILKIIVFLLLFIDSMVLLNLGVQSDNKIAFILGFLFLIINFVIILNEIPNIFTFNSRNRDLFISGIVSIAYCVAFGIIILSIEFKEEYFYSLLIGVIIIIGSIIGSITKILKEKDLTVFNDERYQYNYIKSQAMAGIVALLTLVQLIVIEQIYVIEIPAYSCFFVTLGAWGSTIAAYQFYYKHWG